MKEISLVDKLDILMDLISSSSVFLVFSMLSVFFLISLIICIVTNKKVNKWLFIIVAILSASILIINYGTIFITILDKTLDNIFMALYFPSFSIYITMLLIANTIFIFSVFSKKQLKLRRIINIVQPLILNLFLILVIDVVSKNDINIYEAITLYSNQILLVLLQLSMGIFVSNILINLLISAKIKLEKYDRKEYQQLPELIFD